MLVEDLRLYMISLRSLLEVNSELIIVAEAQDGLQAVTLANEFKPDVILMDIGLPNLNGIEATKIIKEKNPDIKIIILSSHIDEDEVIKCLEGGANAYALKDIKTDYLMLVIKSVFSGAFWLDPKIANAIRNKRPDLIGGKF